MTAFDIKQSEQKLTLLKPSSRVITKRTQELLPIRRDPKLT